jgi:hypothetical protein
LLIAPYIDYLQARPTARYRWFRSRARCCWSDWASRGSPPAAVSRLAVTSGHGRPLTPARDRARSRAACGAGSARRG